MPESPIKVDTMEITQSAWPVMGRTYTLHRGFKIYEIEYPFGDNAAYFVFIEENRHYFKSRLAVHSYLDRHLDDRRS